MNLPELKTVVTYLEMMVRPQNLEEKNLNPYALKLINNPNTSEYIDIYREVGRNYIWNYRAGQSFEEIDTLIHSSSVELMYLFHQDRIIGLAELNILNPAEIEIVHFGLIPDFIEKGIGRRFFNNVLFYVWSKNPEIVWLSTCDLDHHKAINFYQAAGFSITKTKDAVFKDYRYSDFYNKQDAPQIPLAD